MVKDDLALISLRQLTGKETTLGQVRANGKGAAELSMDYGFAHAHVAGIAMLDATVVLVRTADLLEHWRTVERLSSSGERMEEKTNVSHSLLSYTPWTLHECDAL